MRLDRSIIEGLQDIVSLLEEQLKPLVQSELSLLVDILYRPELLFPAATESRKRCENGGFIRRYTISYLYLRAMFYASIFYMPLILSLA